MATAGKSSAALRAFMRIVGELRQSDKSFGRASPQFKYLMAQMRGHQLAQLTQRIFAKGDTEMEHVAHLYASYLSSTRRLLALQEQYKGGERSVEESANLVGLALPKRR